MYSKYLNGNKTIRLLALRECEHFVAALAPSALWKKLPLIFEIWAINLLTTNTYKMFLHIRNQSTRLPLYNCWNHVSATILKFVYFSVLHLYINNNNNNNNKYYLHKPLRWLALRGLRTLRVRLKRPSGVLPALYNFLAFNNFNLYCLGGYWQQK